MQKYTFVTHDISIYKKETYFKEKNNKAIADVSTPLHITHIHTHFVYM